MGWVEFYAKARRQHGAFAVRDSGSVGLTDKIVAGHATRQVWCRPHPGIVVVPGYQWDHRSFLAAAQLYLGESAAASDMSAAWLYGLVPQPPTRPHLLLPHARRVRPDRLVLHRSRNFGAADRSRIDGISVVTVAFLLISLAGRATTETMLGFAIDARQRRLFDPIELAERLETVGPVPGRARLARMLIELMRDGSDSMFESRVRNRLGASGFAPSTAPVAVDLADGQTVHLDIAFPAERVAIECQGFVAHHSRRQLDRDARRDNRIALAGDWLVLKLTWDRFRHDWQGFTSELRRALASRA